MNEHNLIDQSKRTPEERKRIASKGGKASVESKKRKKMIAELANDILYSPLNEVEKLACDKLGIKPSKVKNKGTLGFLACFHKAMKDGNTLALERLFKIAGEITEIEPEGGESHNQALIYLPEEEDADGSEDI